jgi:hypothetical protein
LIDSALTTRNTGTQCRGGSYPEHFEARRLKLIRAEAWRGIMRAYESEAFRTSALGSKKNEEKDIIELE